MVPGTEAQGIIESHPQIAENYLKATEALKNRFGRENLLVQVYIRELLKLVIRNVNSSEKISLPKMYVKLESHLRALSSLKLATADPSTWLFPLVESSLPEDILRAWQRSPLSKIDGSMENPPKNCLAFLMEFLKNEVQGEQQISLASEGFGSMNMKKKKVLNIENKTSASSSPAENIPTAAGLHAAHNQFCVFCDNETHESRDCLKAQLWTLEECRRKAKEKNRCTNCLRAGHFYKICKAPVKCMICSRKHLTLMCPDRNRNKQPETTKSSCKPKHTETVSITLNCTREVILQMLLVKVRVGSTVKKVRALIDNGSQRSYIQRRTAEELQLSPKSKLTLCHIKFGNTRETQEHNEYSIEVTELNDIYSCNMDVLDQGQICGKIPRVTKGKWTQELRKNKIWINDMGDGSPEIEVLIGADYYGKIMTGRTLQLQNGLTAVETRFGWTLLGKQQGIEDNIANTVTSMFVSDIIVPEFWKLETIGILDPIEVKSKVERDAEVKAHFENTVSRAENGRYSVSLPWIDEAQDIPDNRIIAEKRLQSATAKLIKENKYEQYDNIFENWLKEEFIETVEEGSNHAHFLPHRPVFKTESKTTPVRPVFDASCKTGRNPSLNDCMEKGPNLLELLTSILLRFRIKKIGVTADIRKAFQMIEVKEADRKYLNFLWWDDYQKKTFKIYRHTRVVFGINCSPFLLGAVLDYHLKQVSPENKEVAEILEKSLYVDNLVTSVDTEEDYRALRSKATSILSDAKMDLRLWEYSGDKCELNPSTPHSEPNPCSQILGLMWNKDEDTLCCETLKGFEVSLEDKKLTKRNILSIIAKVFDPIGFTCPALIPPKLILQESWAAKLGWDEELPEEGQLKFRKWFQEIASLFRIHIPRYAFAKPFLRENCQLHCFSDASNNAYATTIYIRVEHNDSVSVQLLQAKARVAPIKRPTIPRMELLACTIGARLGNSLQNALRMEDVPTFYWTDSTTALQWIKRNDNWGTFVGNRVKEICQLTTPEDWRHVPGIHNPADLPSRGCNPVELLHSKWWEGPVWLRKDSYQWPMEELMKEKSKAN